MELTTSRLALRGLCVGDFSQWSEVRLRCTDWLEPWEPRRVPGAPDTSRDQVAFASRCRARERERQLGTGFAFGVFLHGAFVGEVNVSNVRRGPFQSADIGYWIDEKHAGKGLIPEAVVAVLGYLFEKVGLHRIEISIVPRNEPSLRLISKLGIRAEGIAERFLEIDGVWEDHIRHAITAEEWHKRGKDLLS